MHLYTHSDCKITIAVKLRNQLTHLIFNSSHFELVLSADIITYGAAYICILITIPTYVMCKSI